MTTYYVMRMFSTGFSPILEYTTTNHDLAFNVRDDLEAQNPDKTYVVLKEAPLPISRKTSFVTTVRDNIAKMLPGKNSDVSTEAPDSDSSVNNL